METHTCIPSVRIVSLIFKGKKKGRQNVCFDNESLKSIKTLKLSMDGISLMLRNYVVYSLGFLRNTLYPCKQNTRKPSESIIMILLYVHEVK